MMKNKPSPNHKRRARTHPNRPIIIGGVVLLAVFAALIMILLNPPSPTTESIVKITSQVWPDANGKSLGKADARVVIAEYADFQCPYCRQFHDNILPQILRDYIETGKARLEYHHFIVIDSKTGGSESRRAAEASECANEQGAFWDYFNILFNNQQSEGSGAFADDHLKTCASALKLDTQKFNTCLDSGKYAQQVTEDDQGALSRLLPGTPSVLVNNTLVASPLDYTQVKNAIEAALNQPAQ